LLREKEKKKIVGCHRAFVRRGHIPKPAWKKVSFSRFKMTTLKYAVDAKLQIAEKMCTLHTR
jgi:hypothetical protein